MNVIFPLLVALAVVALGYRFYSNYLSRVFGIDPTRRTPAVELQDGADYCPTKSPVVFAHHFASIAGAGPIIGPTMALMYGYLPVWVWILLGGIFFGAVHDYATLFVSIRERGKSIAEIARKSLGDSGFALMISFTIVMILLVTSAFLSASANSLTSLVSLVSMNLPENQAVLQTVVKDGVSYGKIGGIASSSVIVITLFAPLIGFLNYRRNTSLSITIPLAIAICIVSIVVGLHFPVSLSSTAWMIVLALYTFVAAGVPVWIILQPRDFVNVYILYGGIALLLAGIVFAGIQGVTINAPALNIANGTASPSLGMIWPFLFITVACGAISGFHALVAGGTVSKQITNENATRTIGYGGMLIETLLAVAVVITLAAGMPFSDYAQIVHPASGKSNPILAFSLGMGGLLYKGLHLPVAYGTVFGILMVEGFVATTLDTAVRINRYLFEELWGIVFRHPPRWIKSYLVNSALSVILMVALAFTNAFGAIWPVFGTANQLLAALTLITLAVWMAANRKKNLFLLLPAIFMVATTLFSLLFLAKRYFVRQQFVLFSADLLLLALALGLVVVAVKVLFVKKHCHSQGSTHLPGDERSVPEK